MKNILLSLLLALITTFGFTQNIEITEHVGGTFDTPRMKYSIQTIVGEHENGTLAVALNGLYTKFYLYYFDEAMNLQKTGKAFVEEEPLTFGDLANIYSESGSVYLKTYRFDEETQVRSIVKHEFDLSSYTFINPKPILSFSNSTKIENTNHSSFYDAVSDDKQLFVYLTFGKKYMDGALDYIITVVNKNNDIVWNDTYKVSPLLNVSEFSIFRVFIDNNGKAYVIGGENEGKIELIIFGKDKEPKHFAFNNPDERYRVSDEIEFDQENETTTLFMSYTNKRTNEHGIIMKKYDWNSDNLVEDFRTSFTKDMLTEYRTEDDLKAINKKEKANSFCERMSYELEKTVLNPNGTHSFVLQPLYSSAQQSGRYRHEMGSILVVNLNGDGEILWYKLIPHRRYQMGDWVHRDVLTFNWDKDKLGIMFSDWYNFNILNEKDFETEETNEEVWIMYFADENGVVDRAEIEVSNPKDLWYRTRYSDGNGKIIAVNFSRKKKETYLMSIECKFK